jgi:hypothetical protein
MKLLELFSGSCTVSKEAELRGYEVRNLDIVGDPTYKIDLLTWDYKDELSDWIPDFIWASCPCECFSFAQNLNIGRGFPPDMTQGRLLLNKTIDIIEWLKTKNNDLLFVIENPLGRMRKEEILQNIKRQTVSYCKYGKPYRKNTDLWNNIDNLQLEICKKDCPFIINGKHQSVCLRGRTIRETLQPSSGDRKQIQAIPSLLINSILDQI